jgi:hypothetical protein
MIVYDLDVERPVLRPPETYPPLIIYADRMLTSAASLQRLKAVGRRYSQIVQPLCGIKRPKLPAGDRENLPWKPLRALAVENCLRDFVPEPPDQWPVPARASA